MKYFQTDDRDDYFASLTSERITPKQTSLTLIMNDKIILNKVQNYEISRYYKKNHINDGSSPRRVWRDKLIELGYDIINNYDE